MKRWLAIVLCVMILWSLVGCGKQEEPVQPETEQSSEEPIPVSSEDGILTLNKKELTILEGETFELQLLQNGEVVEMEALWSSNIPAVVEVDENGVIKAISVGVAEVKVRAGAQVLRCRVIVQSEETRLAEEEQEAEPDDSVTEELELDDSIAEEPEPGDNVPRTVHELEGIWSSEMTFSNASQHVSFTCILPNHTILRFGYRYLDAGQWTADGERIVADVTRYNLSTDDEWVKTDEGTVTFGYSDNSGKLRIKDSTIKEESAPEYLTPYRVNWFRAYDSCASGIDTYQEIGANLWWTQQELNQGFGMVSKLWEGLEAALYSRVWDQATPENRTSLEQEERIFLRERDAAMKGQETEGSMAPMNMATAAAEITKSRVMQLLTMLPDAETGDLEYILPMSDSKYLTEKEIASLSHRELWLARNEIYARHGYIFSGSLQEYFESQSWYEGLYTKEEFDREVLNRYEVANIDLIKEYEIAVYGKTYSE